VQVAALYDVHGNLPALEAVLAVLEDIDPDVTVVGGDVLWGPWQVECVERLSAVGARFLAGNCERDVLSPESETDRWSRAQLDAATVEQVSRWPETIELDIAGLGRVLFCHATPRSLVEIVTARTPDDEVEDALDGVVADVVVCGHTHVQFDRVVAGMRLVNAGSVGMPYEGRTAAYWVLLGPDVRLLATTYDVDATVAAIGATGYPGADDLVETLLEPHGADEATDLFEARRRGT
jgi:putative phosphoesterase